MPLDRFSNNQFCVQSRRKNCLTDTNRDQNACRCGMFQGRSTLIDATFAKFFAKYITVCQLGTARRAALTTLCPTAERGSRHELYRCHLWSRLLPDRTQCCSLARSLPQPSWTSWFVALDRKSVQKASENVFLSPQNTVLASTVRMQISIFNR